MFLEIEVREEQKSFHQKYKRQKKKKKKRLVTWTKPISEN